MWGSVSQRVLACGVGLSVALGCSASGGDSDSLDGIGAGAGSGNVGGSPASGGTSGAASGGDSAASGSGGSAAAGAGTGAGGSSTGGPPGMLGDADTLCTFLLIGPSDAAGYNAQGRNAPGGFGFARLLVDNNPAFPTWAGKHLSALWPGVRFIDHAESGFTTEDMLTKLERQIDGIDRGAPGCDTWVHIGSPGNDFNDNVATIINPSETAKVAGKARQNLAAMSGLVRQRFRDPSEGRTLILTFSNIQDPTDGTGSVPSQFTDGFCKQMHNPLFTSQLRQTAIQNLANFNQAIADEAAAQSAHVVDQHAAIFGHGMPAAERWLADDCTHPNNLGHHAIRVAAWALVTGTGSP